MANNAKPILNKEHIRDLLSPYLDNEVSDQERALVQQGLNRYKDLRQELEALRKTTHLLQRLPDISAPRPFTISEADVGYSERPARRFFALPVWAGGLAGLAALFVCALAIGGLFLSLQTTPGDEIAILGGVVSAPASESVVQDQTVSEAIEDEEATQQEKTGTTTMPEDGAAVPLDNPDRPAVDGITVPRQLVVISIVILSLLLVAGGIFWIASRINR
ncbi:MAG: zf-HC2 domain-containing protein [Pseudomonadota bacterium]